MRRRNLAHKHVARAHELEHLDPLLSIVTYWLALEIDPQCEEAYLNLGTMMYKVGDFELAKSFYEHAIFLDPNFALAHFNLGNVHDELREYSLAITEYLTAIKLVPDYADAHYNLANTYQKSGAERKSIHHWQKYERLDRVGTWHESAIRQRRMIVQKEGLFIASRRSA
jgi:tetratricopeptide (TPR) repeat protein